MTKEKELPMQSFFDYLDSAEKQFEESVKRFSGDDIGILIRNIRKQVKEIIAAHSAGQPTQPQEHSGKGNVEEYAVRFLKERGLKDTLFDVANPEANQWIKGGLSELLREFATRYGNIYATTQPEIRLPEAVGFVEWMDDNMWVRIGKHEWGKIEDDHLSPITAKTSSLYAEYQKTRNSAD